MLLGIVPRIGLCWICLGLAGFKRIQGLHFRLFGVITRLRILVIIELLLRFLQIRFGSVEMNRGFFSRPGLFGNGNCLPCIAHFLHRRRRFTARHQQDSGDQESLREHFESDCFHILFLLLETAQRYQPGPPAVKLARLR